MPASPRLKALIVRAAPYWAGEAEVFRTYWTWSGRSVETDRGWLALQCYKEVFGASADGRRKGPFLGPLEQLFEMFEQIDIGVDRHEVLDIAEGLWAEFAHYCAFADVYDSLRDPGDPKINPAALQAWRADRRMPGRTEDDELTALRNRHVDRHGPLGTRALRFTEGGYCTLYSEGMRLAVQPTARFEPADRAIARACTRVWEDEFGHMLKGIAGLDEEGLSEADWALLGEISVEQLKGRIRMRNAQFGGPLAGRALEDALAGRCAPIAFDFARAGLAG